MRWIHVVDVDQSGKFENTQVDTVVAFSNGIQFTVLIPAQVKRDCVTQLRGRGVPPPTFYVQLFATCLYFLLRNHIERLTHVTIDIEYSGKNAQIKEHLLHLLRRRGHTVESAQIGFGLVGKKSGAHSKAIAVFRGEVQPNVILRLEDVLGEFKTKKQNRGLP